MNTKNPYNDLLDSILLSIKSKDSNEILEPNRSNHIDINEKSEDFLFSIVNPEMKYKYSIRISKVNKLFRNRYISKIEIIENKQWGSNLENLIFDSIKDNSYYKQSAIFEFLKKRHIEKEKEKNNEKVNKYINDVSKSHNKQVTRDEKLNKILS